MFNKFEYEEMLSQCDIVGLKLISEILWCSTIVLHRKEKMICVQHEIQRRINEGGYE